MRLQPCRHFNKFSMEVEMKAIKSASIALAALGLAFTTGCHARHSTKEVFYLISVNRARSTRSRPGRWGLTGTIRKPN